MATYYVTSPNHATLSRALNGTTGNAGTLADPMGLEEAVLALTDENDDIALMTGAGGSEADFTFTDYDDIELDFSTIGPGGLSIGQAYIRIWGCDDSGVQVDKVARLIADFDGTGSKPDATHNFLMNAWLDKLIVKWAQDAATSMSHVLCVQSTLWTNCEIDGDNNTRWQVFWINGYGGGGQGPNTNVFENTYIHDTGQGICYGYGGGSHFRSCIFDNINYYSRTASGTSDMFENCVIRNCPANATQWINGSATRMVLVNCYINLNGKPWSDSPRYHHHFINCTVVDFDYILEVNTNSYYHSALFLNCILKDGSKVFGENLLPGIGDIRRHQIIGSVLYNITTMPASSDYYDYSEVGNSTADPTLDADGIPATPIQLTHETINPTTGLAQVGYRSVGYHSAQITGTAAAGGALGRVF